MGRGKTGFENPEGRTANANHLERATMSLLEIGKTGASKQSWRSGPKAILKKLLDEAKDPHAGKVLFSDFLAIVLPSSVRDAFENEEDERRMVAIVEYWFTNHHKYMSLLYPQPGDEKREKIKRAEVIEKQATIRKAIKQKIKDEAELLLLDWVMPNGKRMGDCTGNDIRKFGRKVAPWLTKIAARVKPNEIVRDVLTEVDVRNMWGKSND